MMRRFNLFVGCGLLAISATACTVAKSDNPLAPTVAGPIPGVGISAPGISAPPDGTRIPFDKQPVTLAIANSQTNGVRPLDYRFELALDKGFATTFFSKDGIAPDGSGQTTVTLPGMLGPERGYYWRAKAYDGANESDYSSTVYFEVYTPVVLGPPFPEEPIGSITSRQPRFKVANAKRVGPAGPIEYNVQVAKNGSFGSLIGNWFMNETADESHIDSPVRLDAVTTYYWRARAREETAGYGPWSSTVSFTTPAPTPKTPPPSASCGPPFSSPLQILTCHRNQYGTPMTSSEILSFLRASAHDLNNSGLSIAGSGPFGIFPKSGGNNCGGYSCDIICRTDGSWWDVLSDQDNTAVPNWGTRNTGGSDCEIVP